MGRAIDADALLKTLKFLANKKYNRELTTSYSNVYKEVMGFIKCAPTIEPTLQRVESVEIKRGHWITWFENEDVRQAKCSECGMMFTLGKGRDIHYCGNCGAKMDEMAVMYYADNKLVEKVVIDERKEDENL